MQRLSSAFRGRAVIEEIADWLLPPNVFRALTTYRPSAVGFYLTHRSVLAANREVENRHRGERCFVLCNGPSVNRQNLEPLCNEIVFSVSTGHYHPRFSAIRPRYHVVPQLTYGHLTRDGAIKWFQEMHAGLGAAELFLAAEEYELVRENGLFPGRTVRFLCLGRNHFSARMTRAPDLTGILPRVQTVPILAIMIALYMGFKEIYLLGIEHDWFIVKRYDYSFERQKLHWKDEGVTSDGAIVTGILDDLPIVQRVWEQHRAMRLCAEAIGATIMNATDGGLLDVYPRVALDSLLDRPTAAVEAR